MLPTDQEMKDNVEFYREEAGDRDWFRPREEAVHYVHRDNDEEALLTFIETQFTFDGKEKSGDITILSSVPKPPPVVRFSW